MVTTAFCIAAILLDLVRNGEERGREVQQRVAKQQSKKTDESVHSPKQLGNLRQKPTIFPAFLIWNEWYV
jgi:hypothetical protein